VSVNEDDIDLEFNISLHKSRSTDDLYEKIIDSLKEKKVVDMKK
jgi:hypothetical protein